VSGLQCHSSFVWHANFALGACGGRWDHEAAVPV
jgi:hypothetical protein